MALRIQTGALTMLTWLVACSLPSIEATGEGPVVLLDATAPIVEVAVTGCTASDPQDLSAYLTLQAAMSTLDDGATGTVALGMRKGQSHDGDPEEELVDVAGSDTVDASAGGYGIDAWQRSEGKWCLTTHARLRHVKGAAVQADLRGLLLLKYEGDEPRGLTVTVEVLEEQ